MVEQWKECCEGFYEVSDLGQVRRLRACAGARAGRIRKLNPDTDGYLQLHVSMGGVHQVRKVHQLVAETFIGPCPDGLEVNHEDGVKTNNHVDNLEYTTQLENIHHACRTGLRRVKYPQETIDHVRSLRAEGMLLTEIAEQTGVSATYCSAICNGLYRKNSWVYKGG